MTPLAPLLEAFFTVHDPTTMDRQGPDLGEQYRSIILYHDEAQKATAEKVIRAVQAEVYDDPIVTEGVPLDTFLAGEAGVPREEFLRRYPCPFLYAAEDRDRGFIPFRNPRTSLEEKLPLLSFNPILVPEKAA